MEKLKRGVITGLQAIGIFFLSLFVYAFYPQNTVMSWICLIITIAIVYVFIRKSKRFAIGLLILYLLVGILAFWLTGGLSLLIHNVTESVSKTGPKLMEALQELIMGGAIVFVLYKLFVSGFNNRSEHGRFKDDSPVYKRKKNSGYGGYDEDGGYEKSDNSSAKGVINGSDDYWKISDHAKRIYDNRVSSESSDEREVWIRNGNKFADRLREKYGVDDPEIEYLIEKYYLDHKS